MEVTDNVYLVPGKLWASHIYILNDTPLTLVDTGLPYSLEALEETLKGINREMSDIELILHTHGHVDHIGSTARIKQTSPKAIVSAHDADESLFDGCYQYRGWNRVGGLLDKTARLALKISYFKLDRYIDNEIDLLGGLRVIHTPGHTPGSVCFYSERYGILFSGDTLGAEGTRLKNKWFYSKNPEQQIGQIHWLLDMGFDKLLPGHYGLILSNASKRLRNSR